jgi:hypothetical protein
MRPGFTCLAAMTLVFIAACSSGTTPQGQTSRAGTVAADDPLLVPPGLTERPGTPRDGVAGEPDTGGARAIR